jgi:hypothetical protein
MVVIRLLIISIVSGVDEKPILTRGNLLQGFSESEYISHAIENRSLQSIFEK